jgi:hypothetical protein
MSEYRYENIKTLDAPLRTIAPEWNEIIKIIKGNEKTEDYSLRITPISAGPAKSGGNGCASPIQMEGDSIGLYNY